MALPKDFTPDFIERIYDGMNRLAATPRRRHRRRRNDQQSGTAADFGLRCWATWRADKCILRSGAKAGDALFVTGELGGSLAGKHLEFEPRLAEARWLAGTFSHSRDD